MLSSEFRAPWIDLSPGSRVFPFLEGLLVFTLLKEGILWRDTYCKQKLNKQKQRQIETERHTDTQTESLCVAGMGRGSHGTAGSVLWILKKFLIHKVGGIVTG